MQPECVLCSLLPLSFAKPRMPTVTHIILKFTFRPNVCVCVLNKHGLLVFPFLVSAILLLAKLLFPRCREFLLSGWDIVIEMAYSIIYHIRHFNYNYWISHPERKNSLQRRNRSFAGSKCTAGLVLAK